MVTEHEFIYDHVFYEKKKTNYCNKYGKTFSNFMVKDISTVDLRLVYSIYTV